MNEKNDNRNTNADANVEPNVSDASLGKKGSPTFDSLVRVSFHHIRKRLADIDGLSGKAALDGVVEAKILATDSPKQVTQVTHSQSKGKEEATIITIEACSDRN